MLHIKQDLSKRRAPIVSRQFKAYVIVLTATILAGCSGGSQSTEQSAPQSSNAVDAQRRQYLEVCTRDEAFKRDKQTQLAACECVYEAARKRLNDVQMDMLIAIRARDKQKQDEIRARPDYSPASFKANMKGFGTDAVECVVSRSAS